MLDDELGSWLARCGELVTVATRVLRECDDLCMEYSLRYLIVLFSLELKQLCDHLGVGGLSRCYEVLGSACSGEAIGRLARVLSVGEVLRRGVYVGASELVDLAASLPELYVCTSRSIFELLTLRRAQRLS